MAHTILKKFHPSAKLLDDMIFRLETNLGRTHSVTPFTQLYSKYSFSTNNTTVVPPTAEIIQPKEEEKKQEAQVEAKPLPTEVKQAAAPKKEAAPAVKGGKKGGKAAEPVEPAS